MTALKDCADTFDNIFTYGRITQIQNIFVPGHFHSPPLHLHHPLRMLPVQIAVQRHHLRFKPESESNSFFFNVMNQFRKGPPKLFLIGYPVSHGRCGIIAFSKPPVIQYKQFCTCPGRLFCQLQKTFFMKIKITGFPAVQKHRTFQAGKAFRNQAVPIQPVKNPGHSPQPLPGIDHHGLRRLKAFAWQQGPGKVNCGSFSRKRILKKAMSKTA